VTVSELSERELVHLVQQRLSSAAPWIVVGIGDDAAVVEPERNRLEVITVDAVVDQVHVDRRFTPPDAIGHRALAVNLSDLAAMGAAPRLAVLSMALPPDLSRADFEAIVDGVATLSAGHRIPIVGGNLTRTPGPLTVDITAVGTVKRRSVLTRTGARPGDVVFVTGTLGAAAAGLDMLREAGSSAHQGCIERYLRPSPRVRAGLLLGRNRAASSCVDLSDGLADGVARIGEASGVGIALDAVSLPVDAAAGAWWKARGQPVVERAITSGDDYELLFTVRPRHMRRLDAVARHGAVPLTRIGICTTGHSLVLRSADGGETPIPAGFSHFR
jgi:thiamine-monophosphate kinase